MNIKDIIKKQTTLIAIAIIMVTITVMGVSYSLFFKVDTGSDQVITAGTLEVTISGDVLNNTDPMTEAQGLASSPFTYTVSNADSNLPASYTLCIAGTSSNTIELKYIKISLDGSESKELMELPTVTVTDDSDNEHTCYVIGSGTLNANATSDSQEVYIWIDEDSIEEELKGTLDLKLYVIGEVDES